MTWTKEMALEIIAAGFRSMSRKYHPDVGGSHEDMLALTSTKEHLEKFIAGGRVESTWHPGPDFTRARSEPRRSRNTWRNKASEPTGEVPIEPYPHDPDYYQLADVTIAGITEKAIKIKIPRVKNPQWLPKSQLHEEVDLEHMAEGDVLTVIFTRWIAQQKGWLK